MKQTKNTQIDKNLLPPHTLCHCFDTIRFRVSKYLTCTCVLVLESPKRSRRSNDSVRASGSCWCTVKNVLSVWDLNDHHEVRVIFSPTTKLLENSVFPVCYTLGIRNLLIAYSLIFHEYIDRRLPISRFNYPIRFWHSKWMWTMTESQQSVTSLMCR